MLAVRREVQNELRLTDEVYSVREDRLFGVPGVRRLRFDTPIPDHLMAKGPSTQAREFMYRGRVEVRNKNTGELRSFWVQKSSDERLSRAQVLDLIAEAFDSVETGSGLEAISFQEFAPRKRG